MEAFDTPHDLVDAINEAKVHVFNRAIFWPRRWQEFNPPTGINWKWKSVPFVESAAAKVPNDEHGIYSFVLCPNIAKHPKNHFVLYVGKADKMTLRQRFKSYFHEMKKIKRPAICYHLNQYEGYLEFCFTPVTNQQEIEPGEDALLLALLPPCNSDFPAEVSQVIKGIR
jgi:hypothetical protein